MKINGRDSLAQKFAREILVLICFEGQV